MVLEATTDPSASSDFTSDVPPSDFPSADSDVSPNQLQATYNLDISTLPRANFISASLLGRNEARLRQLIAGNVSAAAQRMHRMPTQDEFNALSYHTAKGQAIASYGAPTGILAGAYRSYATRESYKFPFMKATEGFNPQVVVLGGRTWLTGDRARVFWHALRFTAYGIGGGWFAGMCLTAYAASVMAVGELTDPRLKALQEAVRREAKAYMEGKDMRQGKKVDNTGQGDTSAGELWKRHRTSIGANNTPGDDASPSAGQQETEFAHSMAVEEKLYGDATGTGEMVGAGGGQARDVASASPTRQTAWSRAVGRARTNPTNPEPDPVDVFPDNYDDKAFPTAMDASSTASADPASGGNAWDRIRREAGATDSSLRSRRGRNSSQPMSPREDTAGADDRERAQREFDTQLERERQGGSFGGGGRGREW